MRRWVILLFALVLCFVLATGVNAVSTDAPLCPSTSSMSPEDTSIAAKIEDISTDQSSIQIRCRQDKKLITTTIAVNASELQAALQHFGKGDQVDLQYGQEDGQIVLKNLSITTLELGWFTRVLAFMFTLFALLFIFWLMLGNKLLQLIIGTDNRYSNSKTQIALWFLTLIAIYITTITLRGFYGGIDFVGGVTIPQNLLVLSGLSALTFATAKGIAQDKIGFDENGKANNLNLSEPKLLDDLFQNDRGGVDLGDFQMIIITLIAVLVYLAEFFGFLGTIELHKIISLPDVDTTILTTFSLGQGAYLAKKFIVDGERTKPESSPDGGGPSPT